VKDTPRQVVRPSALVPTQPPLSRTKVIEDVSPLVIWSNGPKKSLELSVRLQAPASLDQFPCDVLVDSGATSLFIDDSFATRQGLKRTRLPRAIPILNVDGSPNENGKVMEVVELFVHYNDHTDKAKFYVTALGGVPAILGHSWLTQHNPEFDWVKGKVEMSRCPGECGRQQHEWVRATFTQSQKFAVQAKTSHTEGTTLPVGFEQYAHIFTKESFDALPEHGPYCQGTLSARPPTII